MLYVEFLLILAMIVFAYIVGRKSKGFQEITPPKLENNPSFDVIVTETTPMMTFFNAKGGSQRVYDIEIDTKKDFSSTQKIKLSIAENDEFVTKFKIKKDNELKDQVKYYWRARTVCASGDKSLWTSSRFYVDSSSDMQFSQLSRIKIKKIEASAGYNVKNIIDTDDPGLSSFWQSPPPAPGNKKHWISFDLVDSIKVSRMWILSNPQNSDGWLKDFELQYSLDGKKWTTVKGGLVKNNDTFRNIVDFTPIKARFLKLVISKYIGYAAQINEVLFFTPQMPDIPKTPNKNYVLVIGNEHNGYTFTELAKHIENLGLGVATLTIPCYKASWAMIQKLTKKPVAIVLSGNNADYPQLPMFEYNGVFEIIRHTDIPLLGICAGHQFLAMAYGYTRAASMGWSDISAMEPIKKMTHIKITKNDPIFSGINDNFIAPEIHGWAVMEPAQEFEVIARSSYIQAQKSNERMIYGVQFHGEIDVDYNQAKQLIGNFLKIVMNKPLK